MKRWGATWWVRNVYLPFAYWRGGTEPARRRKERRARQWAREEAERYALVERVNALRAEEAERVQRVEDEYRANIATIAEWCRKQNARDNDGEV